MTPARDPQDSPLKSIFRVSPSDAWVALVLAVVAFMAYWPSLKSGFVYDARLEIIDEGFITSLSNLPAVLSLKVLGMNLILGSRPGEMLYLMLIAAICGKHALGYHLCSNLLHAVNVALLYVLLCRLIATEITGLGKSSILKVQMAMAAVTLIFALHPIAVESVAEISYSSSLLVTFFTLVAFLAAITFDPKDKRSAITIGSVAAFCAFASVTCKESGIATPLLLVIYWFLFRRREEKRPWFLFLGAATAVTVVFLAARFLLAPSGQVHLHYLGGSFFRVFLIQPRLWVFMMGKLLWPTHLSADYTIENVNRISTALALVILIVVVLLQICLACKSRVGALGVAIYWLGLVTVSNFIPLNRPLADRFYYLSLLGVAMQLLALLLLLLRSNRGFWLAMAPCAGVLLPLAFLTLTREKVFANDLSLWTDTIQVSPRSSVAHNSLGMAFFQRGRLDEAIAEYQKAQEISPNDEHARNDFGIALFQKGEVYDAKEQFQKALEINPNYAEAHNSLGNCFFQRGQMEEAMAEYQKALEIKPNYVEAHNGLGVLLYQKGEVDAAIFQFQEAVRLNPNSINARNNLAKMKAMIEARGGAK